MDDLVLNLVDSDISFTKAKVSAKGGRWTDRVKVKRAAKRKTRIDEPSAPTSNRPNKKPRHEANAAGEPSEPRQESHPFASGSSSRSHPQIISSLFTSNPKVEHPLPTTTTPNVSQPSNAPLTDSSTFSGLGLDPLIVTHLQSKMNIQKPTSIQRSALPALLSSQPEDTSSRDVFIQAQTGSGKTLSFLLPIIQDLLPLSSDSYIDRSIGTLAIVIVPTRELANQISSVLESLLQLRLRPPDVSPDDPEAAAPRLTRWLVSGLLTGGATRTHEKARLRKGLPILVATPGRLLDHLQNTASFNVGKCRWLVLDEADRLMELGFEETIQGILRGLDGRKRLAMQAVDEGASLEVGGWDWSRSRRTILCSATMRDDVQKLAGTTLVDPIIIKSLESDMSPSIIGGIGGSENLGPEATKDTAQFTPPSQLSQKYVVVPLKLRLVALVALLRSLLSQGQSRRGTKIIVFFSCTDSVDFHWHLLGGTSMDEIDAQSDNGSHDSEDSERADGGDPASVKHPETVALKSDLLPDSSIFRLHGSLPLHTRLSSIRNFASPPDKSKATVTSSSILLCTSVASRGLDLPLVRAVVQYDLPTESGATEYVHRVGRTARAGKGGEAWSFVSPNETEWVAWVSERMQGSSAAEEGASKKPTKLEAIGVNTVLASGFGGKGREFEERATEVQLSFERWVLRNQKHSEFARKAFQSHTRAYATHPAEEKHIFHIRQLHLGHLAKAFALRDAPTAVNNSSTKPKQRVKAKPNSNRSMRPKGHARGPDLDEDDEVLDAEKRMRKVVRAQGRLSKKGGKIISTGTSEFQIAGGDSLEKLVNVSRA